MIRETARKLLPCVNDPKHIDALHKYAQDRIDAHVLNLIRETDHRKINYLQGCIQELQRFMTIREEANQSAKEK
jgi:hypothetical protein|tara:strand:- start:655 stop:876 length:222 start_codon:yes stop_codon:yes gene_type:complete